MVAACRMVDAGFLPAWASLVMATRCLRHCAADATLDHRAVHHKANWHGIKPILGLMGHTPFCIKCSIRKTHPHANNHVALRPAPRA